MESKPPIMRAYAKMTLHKCIRCGHRAVAMHSVRIRNSNLEKIKARARRYNL